MERRKKRSDVPHEAVTHTLEAASAGTDVRAAALAGEEGLLIGGIGAADTLDLLAALGARCADQVEGYGPLETLVEAVSGGEDFYVSRLRVRNTTFYLASIGGRVPRQQEVAAALGRILGGALPV